MRKLDYLPLNIRSLTIETEGKVLSSSIIDVNTTLSIPRGQKVDEYDFSDANTFSQDWEITGPSSPPSP